MPSDVNRSGGSRLSRCGEFRPLELRTARGKSFVPLGVNL